MLALRGNLQESFFQSTLSLVCWRPDLLLGDVQDAFQGQLLKVKAVTLIKVGADRLRVVVDDHSLLAHLSQRSDAGHGAPVKLNAAA